MKQKNDTGTILTAIKDLKIHLDINFATKTDLEASELRTEERAQKHRDKILTGIDDVMKELQGIREDKTIGDHQQKEFNKQVDKRLIRLEQTHQTA